MSGPQATFGIDITANDKTAKGAKSAEKRVGQIPKRAGDVTKASQGLIGTLGKVEEASARAFGGRSLTSGLTKRLSAVREAASAAGTGLGEAAASGSALSSAMTTMGVVAAGTIGVLAAAGYAAFKFADGWAQGAASIGRTAATIGVATKALQEFQAAGERAGVDKGASTSALGNVAQTFNDARYGRNQEALALMMRLGIKQRVGADGQLDTVGMNNDLATAIARQKNAQTRRMIASKFGISDAALPMYLNGGAGISADMKDADSTALVLSDRDVAKGMRIARKGATVSQMKDRALGGAGSLAADGQEAGYDATISAGRASFGGIVRSSFAPAADKIAAGGREISDAASRFAAGVTRTVSGSLADRIEHLGERSRQNQVSPKGAAGVMQVMPATARTQAARMGIQFDEHRYRTDANYNRAIGVSYLQWLQKRFSGDDVLATAAYNAGEGAVDKWVKEYGDPRKGQISDADFTAHIPFKETRDYVNRVVYGETPAQQHHHTHEIHVHPGGVTVKTTTRGSKAVAISHAPVGGR